MIGYDMSWASFHVLEVMSSPKYHHKRVGYLGAVQSFRPDTEVLMLATNLLKKDLGSPTPTVMSLPIATLPHLITPSLALSTLSDLLPRLNHSHSNIRKKTLVTLYRLALVYPEALRAAWPKIKERLMDPDEDPSVTAAIVNVICELGWRRPNDFLPLAPRLFELLVDGGNNWMAIKLIKLFATLTPLEPRLVRKLLPPLTTIIRTTPAMSLLYECINGIIQGGILGADDSGSEEIARLCVTKLRGMIMVDGDPNLKYVALLAFNKIVVTHPFLVSQQEDVILECIDSPDITIRIQALDLVKGMVSGENLISVVSRLMKQLKISMPTTSSDDLAARSSDPDMDSEGEPTPPGASESQKSTLPEDYRIDVITRILYMCSKDNYANVTDFDWYIDVLTQLVRMVPASRITAAQLRYARPVSDVSESIGDELRNVAVKVRAVRPAVVQASEIVLTQLSTDVPAGHPVSSRALKSVSWILGEYASLLGSADDTLNGLLQLLPRSNVPDVTTSILQGTVKVFSSIAGSSLESWSAERKTKICLLLARLIHTLEPVTLHPSLEVQERTVEFVELLKLTSEASEGQSASTDGSHQDPPLLLTQAMPSLFTGWELNSVAPKAQIHVPLPEGIDLDEPIHHNLDSLLSKAKFAVLEDPESDDFEVFYHQRPPPVAMSSAMAPAITRLVEPPEDVGSSYQSASEDNYLDADIVARRKAERLERNKDDPFYIPAGGGATRTSTPIHNILQDNNGPDLDIDSIPIMQLDLGKASSTPGTPGTPVIPAERPQSKAKRRVVVATDETLEGSDSGPSRTYGSENNSERGNRSASAATARKIKQGLLGVDSSTIGSFSLEGESSIGVDHERRQREEAEMQQAVKEVERLRLEMQRANERVKAPQGAGAEGTVVKRRKPKKATAAATGDAQGSKAKPVKKKKKKKPAEGEGQEEAAAGEGDDIVAKLVKKKKKRVAQVEEDESAQV
ncbi:AP-3 complex subunit delta [Geosmithia morbida]|uniref:AP-3 complex subunit delta n=1 Tax=Geosmithia morbida TaxID=1094350 RepID=A0A9P5D1V1_9HYPO|nr:AP-3 complex subunit delta [Geosmithia morbida]KAF4120170.1 AP-3 complex subunit delta [Geosmithia morbida]